MSKLGKHINQQAFDSDLNIDYNYAVFSDSFTLSGIPGFTAFGGTPSLSELYYDVSSITNWSDVIDVLTVSCVFVRDEINNLYIATGGSAAYAGLTQSDKMALAKTFLIPKSDRDLLYTQQEQEDFAAQLILCTDEFYSKEYLKESVNYISNSDEGDIQSFLDNPGNFLGSGGGGTAGGVSSVNGQSGIVILDLNDISDVNTSGVDVNHALIFNGTNWETDLRAPFRIHPDSQNYMNYNPVTGELFLEQLAITDVTVIESFTSSSQYFDNPIHCDSHEEGDTVVFPNATNGVEVWMHNGGSSLTIADYVQIENPSVSESYVKALLSASAPINYNTSTGEISISQSGTASDGYLSSTDWNYFDGKVDTVNGKVGTVILTTSDIVEGTNKYYCPECAWDDFNAGTGLGFNKANGTYYALIDDTATSSNTVLWSANKIYSEIQSISGLTSGVFTVNGQSGIVSIGIDDILTVKNYTDGNNLLISSTDELQFGNTSSSIFNDDTRGFKFRSYFGSGFMAVASRGIFSIYDGPDNALGYNSISLNSSDNTISIYDTTTGFYGYLEVATYSNDRRWTLPDKDGTIAMLSDIVASTGGTGSVNNVVNPLIYEVSTGELSILQAGTASDGYLSSTDYNTFNSKIDGSGISGRMTRWLTGTQISFSQLRDDGLGRLSLGTSTVPGIQFYMLNTAEDTGLSIDNTKSGASFIYGIRASADAASQYTTGIRGGAGSATIQNIGVEGLATGTVSLNIGIKSTAITNNSADNIGGYFEVSNGGSGNAYVLQLIDGNEGAGKVLTSDANGYASWQTPSGGSASGTITGTCNSGYLAVWNNSTDLTYGLIRDDGTSVSIAGTPSTSELLNINSNEFRRGVVINNIYTGGFDSFSLLMQSSGTSSRKKYGIVSQVNGGTQNVGIIGAAVSTSTTYPGAYDIGVVGQSRNTSRGNIGVVGITTINNTGDNIAGYFEASNGGAGNSYVLQLKDGNQANGRVLTSDANGYASWQDPIIGTGGSGTASVLSVNGYTGIVNLSMNDLTDVDTITSTASVGDLLSWDGSDWTPTTPEAVTKKAWTWGAASARNNTTNSYLYKYNGAPTNITPYIAFKDCKILNMSAATNGAETWIAETRINGVVAASMSISGTNSSWTNLDVNVSAGDKIAFYCNGSTIDSPSIEILIQEI